MNGLHNFETASRKAASPLPSNNVKVPSFMRS